MRKTNDVYDFVIEDISSAGCKGWYVRKDGKEAILSFVIRDRKYAMPAIMERADIEAQGLGTRNCGFQVKFDPPLENGEKFMIATADGEVLCAAEIKSAVPASNDSRARLAALVEPFMELDIRKARGALVGNGLFEEYKHMYRQGLAFKRDESLWEELIDILADMKATQHLLCTAYLDQCRKNNVEELQAILGAPYELEEELLIDMRGDITGQGWGKPGAEGRWSAAPDGCTLMLPALSPGIYEIRLEITGLVKGFSADRIGLWANRNPVKLVKVTDTLPVIMNGTTALTDLNPGSLSLRFICAQPGSRDPSPKAPSFRLKSLAISKINP